MSKAKQKPEAEIDFDNRRLCPDGACIGVIGPGGVCKVCGASDDGSVSTSAPVGDELDEEEDDAPESEAPLGAIEADLDEDRELCPDGTCIGVIGPAGTCKECGAVARGS
jgi:hypothetical protein